jgi:hypothetical protein
VANEHVRIRDATATVEAGRISASFELEGGPVDAQWQGAFGRVMEGSLAGIAKRWHFEGLIVAVNGLEPGRGADVAASVQTAVDAANRYVTEQTTARDATKAARAEAQIDLVRAAAEAQDAMQARLGL